MHTLYSWITKKHRNGQWDKRKVCNVTNCLVGFQLTKRDPLGVSLVLPIIFRTSGFQIRFGFWVYRIGQLLESLKKPCDLLARRQWPSELSPDTRG